MKDYARLSRRLGQSKGVGRDALMKQPPRGVQRQWLKRGVTVGRSGASVRARKCGELPLRIYSIRIPPAP